MRPENSGKFLEKSNLNVTTSMERYIFQLRSQPWAGQYFVAKVIGCAYPTCDCMDVKVQCRGGQFGDGLLATLDNRINFTLDLRKHAVRDKVDLKDPQRSFALAFLEEMRSSDWRRFEEDFLAMKQKQIRAIDAKSFELDFPEELMKDPSLMLGYAEAFPLAEGFNIFFGERDWLVDDQYCVNPDCKCQDLIFSLFSFEPNNEDFEKPSECHGACSYNYQTNKWTTVEPPMVEHPSLGKLLTVLKQTYPDLNAELRRRNSLLRLLFKNARNRFAKSINNVSSNKPGRNEPCPCGSGKKFKKCCALTPN